MPSLHTLVCASYDFYVIIWIMIQWHVVGTTGRTRMGRRKKKASFSTDKLKSILSISSSAAAATSSIEFSGLKEIGELAKKKKKVQCKKPKVYSLVYLLVTLALTLPVAIAIVEIAFSAMKFLKNRLRNQMGDQWMNDNMSEIFDGIGNDVVMQRFQNMKMRQGILFPTLGMERPGKGYPNETTKGCAVMGIGSSEG
ncbi:hypothetical protein DVH24_014470 [Malus domestica]|uniref:HAT C-terminal dimerisation domain-containing protein n=1 Tax=Malus domestica TaxID=3750 RepID=A0A498KNA2_MALDO|nr:hypothetical protein DVH24_014470 [Malus domestica]